MPSRKKTALTHNSAGQVANEFIRELRQRIATQSYLTENPTCKSSLYFVERLAELEKTAIALTLGLREVTEYALSEHGVRGIESTGLAPFNTYSFKPTTMTTEAARRTLKLSPSPKTAGDKRSVA